jgi:hypothetical protein
MSFTIVNRGRQDGVVTISGQDYVLTPGQSMASATQPTGFSKTIKVIPVKKSSVTLRKEEAVKADMKKTSDMKVAGLTTDSSKATDTSVKTR